MILQRPLSKSTVLHSPCSQTCTNFSLSNPKSLPLTKAPNSSANCRYFQLFSLASRWLSRSISLQVISPPLPTHPSPSEDFVPFSQMPLLQLLSLGGFVCPFPVSVRDLPNPTSGPMTALTLRAHSTQKGLRGIFLLFWFYLFHVRTSLLATLMYHFDLELPTGY